MDSFLGRRVHTFLMSALVLSLISAFFACKSSCKLQDEWLSSAIVLRGTRDTSGFRAHFFLKGTSALISDECPNALCEKNSP